MTKAEVFIWKHILRASMMGYKFRRQRPALNYIAYFMCTELKLIIEVDGKLIYQIRQRKKIIKDKKSLRSMDSKLYASQIAMCC